MQKKKKPKIVYSYSMDYSKHTCSSKSIVQGIPKNPSPDYVFLIRKKIQYCVINRKGVFPCVDVAAITRPFTLSDCYERGLPRRQRNVVRYSEVVIMFCFGKKKHKKHVI